MEFAELVDAQLRNARALVGTGNPPQPPAPGQPLPHPEPPAGWSGVAQHRAVEQSGDLGRTRNVVDDAKARVHTAVSRVESVGPRALQQLNTVESGWVQERAALRSQRGTPEGMIGLAQAGQQRLAESRQIVSSAVAEYAQSAEAVRAAQRQLPGGVAAPLAHVDPKPPPTPTESDKGAPDPDDVRPYACYLGSKDNDPVKICGPKPALHTWYVENGRFVQVEGDKVTPDAKVEISAGPGEIMETSIDPGGNVGEVKVWLSGPPSPQDFQKWSEGGQRDVNFWWPNPDGSIGVDRRWGNGEVIYQGSLPPGPEWGY
ncbi:MAG: hypothetical protein JST91_19945 [Actinobacteria bacterium]|nr:hypothetical protein [Actinomycetota bacterium]